MPLAIWQGPFDAFDANMQLVRVGDERDVSDGDLLSAHWAPKGTPAPSAPTTATFAAASASSPSTPSGEAD